MLFRILGISTASVMFFGAVLYNSDTDDKDAVSGWKSEFGYTVSDSRGLLSGNTCSRYRNNPDDCIENLIQYGVPSLADSFIRTEFPCDNWDSVKGNLHLDESILTNYIVDDIPNSNNNTLRRLEEARNNLGKYFPSNL